MPRKNHSSKQRRIFSAVEKPYSQKQSVCVPKGLGIAGQV